ncbi:MAG: hypothetical protein EPN93_12605 [Spirochaetes bacterium]|nr:MAG: hypothetical protein EPN93_12605 [Spirochaetota bacterium]
MKKNLAVCAILCAAALAVATGSRAEDAALPGKTEAPAFQDYANRLEVYLTPGFSYLYGRDSLNDRLAANGYPGVRPAYAASGGGIRIGMDRFILGMEGYGFSGRPRQSATHTVTAAGGFATLNIGYAALVTGNFRLYPLLGLGAGGTVLTIEERGTPTFDEIMTDPGRGVTVTTGGPLVNASLQAEYFIRLINRGGIVIGVQAGYMYQFYDPGWFLAGSGGGRDMRDREADGGPAFRLNGLYGGLRIGWSFLF